MGQTTLILMIITVITKIFGFVRESVMAAYIGAGELKSVYTTAITIPTMLSLVVAKGLESGYIPIYNKIKNEKNEETANEFTSNLINILMVYGTIILVMVWIFAGPISKMLSPDLKGESLRLAINYTRIIMFCIYALLYASVMKGYLNIRGNFIDPVLTGIILDLLIIISTIFTGKYGNPYILIFGVLLAYIFQNIRYPFVSKKLGFRYHKTIDFSDKYIKSLFIIVIPIIISTAADQISLLIDNSMASAFFGVSSISKIFYAKTMLNFIIGVVTLTVTTVTFPEIAKLAQKGNIAEMSRRVKSSVVFSMLLVIPATLGMMALSEPIIKLAFERNAFTHNDTNIVASLLVSYGPYIIFISVLKIFANGFYSMEDSKTPLMIVLFQQLLNVILNIIFSKIFGINGLAYATALSSLIASLLFALKFNSKYNKSEDIQNIKSIFKITIVSIIMYIFAKYSYLYLVRSYSYVISLLLSVLLSGLIYLTLIILVKIPEVDKIILEAKKKIGK